MGDSVNSLCLLALTFIIPFFVPRPNIVDSFTFAAGKGPKWIAVGDVNHDGKADILVTNDEGTVTVLKHSISFPGGRGSVAIADLNGDGKDDLIVANIAGNTVTVR